MVDFRLTALTLIVLVATGSLGYYFYNRTSSMRIENFDLDSGWRIVTTNDTLSFEKSGTSKFAIHRTDGIMLPHHWRIQTSGENFKIRKNNLRQKTRFDIRATNNDSHTRLFGGRSGNHRYAHYDGDRNLDYYNWPNL
tara:strand:+ start:42 stop:455 length:414 start_codon:yes stop_codon:yes gene_type:complete